MSEEASILIVDDDAEDLALLKRGLEALVATISTVTDPHEVLEVTRREKPDVVILDALLPGLSGFDLCKQIKTDSALKGIQVLVITGVYLRQQYRQEALQQFKADGFMTKPHKPLELQRLVAQLLAKKTRRPQKSFFRGSGQPTSSEPKTRGFWDRLFGKTEAEEADTRIAPAARAPHAAPQASAPKPEPRPSQVAVVETPVVTKFAEPESQESTSAPVGATTATESESKPDAVMDNASTIALSPDAAVQNPERHAATQPESSSADSESVVAVHEASTSQGSEDLSGDNAPAPEPAPAVPEDASAESAAAPAREEAPVAKEAPVEKAPAAEEVAPDSASTASNEEDDQAPEPPQPPEDVSRDVPAQTLELAPSVASAAPAEQDVEVQWSAESASRASIETLTDVPEEPAPKEPVPGLRAPRFSVRDVPICGEQDFHAELKRELAKCRRVDRPLTLILVQVDDLSQIVELFGKETREGVLIHVAELATWCLRDVDLVGMMTSKDLVAIIAFASDKYGGSRVVDRMRKTVQKNPFRVGEEIPPIMPALRFGMSSYPDDGDDVVGLIAEAYEAIEAIQE